MKLILFLKKIFSKKRISFPEEGIELYNIMINMYGIKRIRQRAKNALTQ